MKLGPKAITTAALAVAVLLAGSIAEAMAYQVNCRALYNQCEQDKCGMFAGMAKDNAGSEEGHQQALVAGACLAACKAKEARCSISQKMKQKFCLGKSCS